MNLRDACLLFKKNAEHAYNIITYHGTDAKFAKSIADTGLKPVKGAYSHLGKQVYLTNDIDAAARYAVGNYNKSPIILEIKLSSHKRIKKN